MILHRLNANTGAMKKLFEAEYQGLKKEWPVFCGEGGYIEKVGPYDYKYRLKFEEAEELERLINDLVEVYNRMVENDHRALHVVTIVENRGVSDEILRDWDESRNG